MLSVSVLSHLPLISCVRLTDEETEVEERLRDFSDTTSKWHNQNTNLGVSTFTQPLPYNQPSRHIAL